MIPFDNGKAEEFYKNYNPESPIRIYAGSRYQRGHGLGNIFSNILQAAIPVVKKGALALGKTALQTGINIARDSINGKKMKMFKKSQKNSWKMRNTSLSQGFGHFFGFCFSWQN